MGLAARKLRMTSPGGFFGRYSFLREFWAEDPNWTNPGNNTTITTVRDNGSLAADLTAGTVGGGAAPKYQTVGPINSKPCFEFNATSETVGGYLRTTSGSNGSALSIVAVGKFNTAIGLAEYLCDSASLNRMALGTIFTNWRAFLSASYFVDAGTNDTNPHLFVMTAAAANNLELLVDGTSIGTDTAGTVQVSTGITLGANNSPNNQCLDGAISYLAVFGGDITAQFDYGDWTASVADHYGITIA